MLVTAVSCRCAVYMQSMTKLADLAVPVRWRLVTGARAERGARAPRAERGIEAAGPEQESRPQTRDRAARWDRTMHRTIKYGTSFVLRYQM